MQFDLNSFRTGDPSIHLVSVSHKKQEEGQTDVIIVGCGPAGLTLAAQPALFPDIQTTIIDQKTGPLEVGQADGVACRSTEMFESFGFADKVLKESYWVNETTF